MSLRVGIILALGISLDGADAMHIPLLVKYHQESHALGGALIGLGTQYIMRDSPVWLRATVALPSAFAYGAIKEYVIDKHPHNSEIPPWVWGCALSFSIKVRF